MQRVPIRKLPENDESNDGERSSKTYKAGVSNVYKASGLKKSFHGDIYQLKLLMLFLIRGLEKGYLFDLATEMDAAEKFDDLVFKYKNETNGLVYRFLQAKHKQDNSKKITINDLLNEKDGEFSLQKYFISFRRIKQNSYFEGAELKDFIICTNIDLDEELQTNSFESIVDEDYLLDGNIMDELSKRLKFKIDNFLEKDRLTALLKKASDFNRLVEKFAEHVLSSPNLDVNLSLQVDLFKKYHGALAKHVVDINTKQFQSDFIDGNLFGEAMEFRNALLKKSKLSKDKFKNDMRKKKFSITDKFGKVLEVPDKSYFEHTLSNDEVTDKEINEFFHKLVFAVNQPNETQLGNIIKQKLGDKFNMLDSDILAGKFLEYMLNWMKQQQGCFLDNEAGKAFFKEAKQQLDNIKSSGLTSFYRERLKEHSIAFSDIAAELLSFLKSSNDNRVFNIANPYRTLLSAIKVDQALDSCQELYKKDDSHIFTSLDDLLILKRIFIEAFESSSNNLLIIECRPIPKTKDLKWLYGQLSRILKNNESKKIILITEKDANYFGEDFYEYVDSSHIKYNKIEDNNIYFRDITGVSQTEVLTHKNVIFQGQEISLGALITRDCLCENQTLETSSAGGILSKLINNEKIEIGKAPPGLGDVENFYIDRVFNRQININANIINDSYFVDTDSSNVRSNLHEDQDIILISDFTGGDFEKICNEYEGHNVHWLTTKFIWQQSRGSLSKLREFVDTNEESVQEYNSAQINDKVVIVSAEPGMGKSTVLTKLAQEAKKTDPSLWVVRVNLNDCTQILNMNKYKSFDRNVDKAVDFLLTVLEIDDRDTFESKLLEYRLKSQGKIILFFDGFDEISPPYKETVIELLEILKDTKVEKLWITTRPYMRYELEDRLSILSYTLKSFSRSNEETFLRRFWSKTLDSSTINEERLCSYAEKLLDLFSKSISEKEVEFASIPLQTRMLAEAFLNDCKQFHNSDLGTPNLPKKLNILDLYERFIKIKYDIYCKEKKKQDTTNVSVLRDQRKLEPISIKAHQQLAIYSLFGKNGLEKLFEEFEDNLIETIKQGDEKTGIIDRISADNIPIFVHRTYAEYFAALWFANYVNREKVKDFIREQIFVEENKVIRYFFDRMLSKEENSCELHVAVLNDNSDRVNELLSDKQTPKVSINSTDKGGRTALHLAAAYGYKKCFSILLFNGINISIIDHIFKWTALSYADKCRQWGGIFESLLRKGANGDDIIEAIRNISATYGRRQHTLLHKAAQRGYVYLVKVLVNGKYGYNLDAVLNAKDVVGKTPLHTAIDHGKFQVVQLLVDNGANLNSKDTSGTTPLHCAAKKGNLNVVQFLVKRCKGVNRVEIVNDIDNDRNTPLHLAAKYAELDVVEFLVKNRSNVNAKNIISQTPLHMASLAGKLGVTKLLVANGANVFATNKNSKTPLQSADARNNPDVVEFLNDAKNKTFRTALHLAADKEGETQLHLAAADGKLKIVQALVRKDYDVNAKCKRLKTPLHYAAAKAHLNVVKFLVAIEGVDVNDKDMQGRTPLLWAAGCGKLDVVQCLVENGAIVNVTNNNNQTPLHLAVASRSLDVSKHLVEKQAAVNAEGQYSKTPLHLAAAFGKLNIVEFLFDNGAIVNAKDQHLKTPLHLAALSGSLEVVKFLVKQGVAVNDEDREGQIPLHYAVVSKNIHVVKFLVESGAIVNAIDKNFKTPLHLAAACGNVVVLRFLVGKIDDVNVKDIEEKTALQYAIENENHDIVAILVEKNKNKKVRGCIRDPTEDWT